MDKMKTGWGLTMLLVTGLLTASPLPGLGAEAVSDAEFTSGVLDLNQSPPEQDPRYGLATRLTTLRLLDQNRRSLGRVNNLLLGKDGNIVSIDAEVSATGFDESLNFAAVPYNLGVESDAFTVALTREQVQDNLPELLQAIETAAGEGADQPVSVKALLGARVATPAGKGVGRIKDILFDTQKKIAVALLVTLSGGSGQAIVAIPYKAVKIGVNDARSVVELTEAQAKIAAAYARRK